MATKALSVDSRENTTKLGKQYKGEPMEKTQRRTLQTLQYSAVGENRLAGKGKLKDENGKSKKKIKPSNERVKVFEDENAETDYSRLEERGTQTYDIADERCDEDDLAEADREALELMGGDVVPENYWKMLAEERRLALNDTLEENEQLYKDLECLKEENEKLTDLASKAEYLANILQSVVSSDDEDSVDDDDYKTGDEQLCNDDDKAVVELCDSDSDGSVYCAAPTSFVMNINKGANSSDSDHESDSGDSEKSGETVLRRNMTKSKKDNCMSKRFSGDWVNVELDDEKVASTEILQAEMLSVLKEDENS